MSFMCITHEHLPGIRPCLTRDQHRITCHDHPGWTTHPGTCSGCLPRLAEHGYLCRPCYLKVETTLTEWDRFVRLLAHTEGKALTPDTAGIRTQADGHVNLPLTVLAVDECESFLTSKRAGNHRTILEWVSTEPGARDAVQFAKAATTAYRTLEVEEREHKIPRIRCRYCGVMNLMWRPPSMEGKYVRVVCNNCDCELDQDWVEARSQALDGVTAPRRSEQCTDGDHYGCESILCRCDCHLDRRVVWAADGDVFLSDPLVRAEWTLTSYGAAVPRRKEAA